MFSPKLITRPTHNSMINPLPVVFSMTLDLRPILRSWAEVLTLLLLPSIPQLLGDSERDQALINAHAAREKAVNRAKADRNRPAFHLTSPANWINDPNGPIFYKGRYHLFYQHNPYGDAWNNMHWGHWVSTDLAQWEHQPIALWPSKSKGEDHCFSGCATITSSGKPLILYTSIGKSEPAMWIAESEDEDLVRWKKSALNPVLTESSPNVNYYDFRDPFVFKHQGKTYLVHGGNLNKAKGGQACVSLYEALDSSLLRWQFKSILFKDTASANIECPNFFRIGANWVLINSPHRRCEYFIGDFEANAGTFTPRSQGLLEPTDTVYAPNTLEHPDGRFIMWGWIRGFKEGMGWNGCMTVPRQLSIEKGLLIQRPVPEIAKLRGDSRTVSPKRLLGLRNLDGMGGRALDIETTIQRDPEAVAGVIVRASADGTRGVKVLADSEHLTVGKVKTPWPEGVDRIRIPLRILVDNSVIEVYAANGALCVTQIIQAEEGDANVLLVSEKRESVFQTTKSWSMKSVWK